MKKFVENKKLLAAVCGGAVAVIALAAVLVFLLVIRPNQLYQTATELFAQGSYEEAYRALEEVPEDKGDREELLPYYAAHAAFAKGDYAAAAKRFAALGDQWEECPDYAAYSQAQVDLENKEYGAAYNAFSALGGFLDSAELLLECRYRMAGDLLEQGDYAGALERFSALETYKDSADYSKECRYQLAVQTLDAGAYGDAYNAFSALGEYKDAVDMLSECRYRLAGDLMAAGDYAGALERLDALDGYQDSGDLAKECRYQQAAALAEQRTLDSLTQAAELYTQIGDYKDAAQQNQSVAAAIEEAKRVPYVHSSQAFFDMDATNPSAIHLVPYRAMIAIQSSSGGYKPYVYSLNVPGVYSATLSHQDAVTIKSMSSGVIEIKKATYRDNAVEVDYYHRVTGIKAVGVYTANGTDEAVVIVRNGQGWSVTGNANNVTIRERIGNNLYNAKAPDSYAGFVGGAITLDAYNYIDLSGYTFYSAEDKKMVIGQNQNGPILTVTNWEQGGELTENYKGYDIYATKSGGSYYAYCNIWPDVYIKLQSGDMTYSKNVIKNLIDNLHKV